MVAINNGLPIFITEYGTTNADAKSGFNAAATKLWLDHKIFYVFML